MKTSTGFVLMPEVAEQVTGRRGAGNYLEYAKAHGHAHIEVLDWTSSAGDWSFIVSKNGWEWYILYQTNNYPRRGFSYEIDESREFLGNSEDVIEEIYAYFS